MKRIVFVLAFAALSTASAFAALPATQPHLEKENAELRARIATLESRITELNARVRQLETMKLAPGPFRLNLGTGRYEVAPQAIVPAQPAMPPGWVPQRFNDGTFYLVPLSEKSTTSVAPIAPVAPLVPNK